MRSAQRLALSVVVTTPVLGCAKPVTDPGQPPPVRVPSSQPVASDRPVLALVRTVLDVRQQKAVTALEARFEVVEVTASQLTPRSADVLLVALPESLSDQDIERVAAAIEDGMPALVLVDPLVGLDLAASQAVSSHEAITRRTQLLERLGLEVERIPVIAQTVEPEYFARPLAIHEVPDPLVVIAADATVRSPSPSDEKGEPPSSEYGEWWESDTRIAMVAPGVLQRAKGGRYLGPEAFGDAPPGALPTTPTLVALPESTQHEVEDIVTFHPMFASTLRAPDEPMRTFAKVATVAARVDGPGGVRTVVVSDADWILDPVIDAARDHNRHEPDHPLDNELLLFETLQRLSGS